MLKTADIVCKDNTFFVSGHLHFNNVMAIYRASLKSIDQSSELSLDFSQVISSDSSALALLIEWVKLAKQQNKKISFNHLSENLLSIAKVAGLEQVVF